jgi:hypothetical protein
VVQSMDMNRDVGMDDGYGRMGVTITGGDECGGEDDRESSRGKRY